MLALLAARTLIAFTAVDRREAGDALPVDAGAPRVAVARGLALPAAAIRTAVCVLAGLADRAPIGFAAEDGRAACDALAIAAGEPR